MLWVKEPTTACKAHPHLIHAFPGTRNNSAQRDETYSPLYKTNNGKSEKQNLEPVFSGVGSNPAFRQPLKKTISIAAEIPLTLSILQVPQTYELAAKQLHFPEDQQFWSRLLKQEKPTPSGKILVDMGCLFGFFILFRIIRQWPLSLKTGCLSHSTFPRRCRSCDKEEFIMPQFGAIIIYSLWFYALLVSCSTIH